MIGFYLNFQRVRERRRYTEEFADEELHEPRAFDVGEKLESDRFQLDDVVEEMLGHQLTMNYLQENGFEKPILIKQMHGLGMKMPLKSFTVSDVKQSVGSRRILGMKIAVTLMFALVFVLNCCWCLLCFALLCFITMESDD